MKKVFLLILALIMVLSVAACAQPTEEAPAEAEEAAAEAEEAPVAAEEAPAEAEEAPEAEPQTIKVGFINDIVDVNSTDWANHVRFQLEALNESQDKYLFTDFTIYNCNMNNDTFIVNVESCVTAGYDIVYTFPVDSVGSVPAYEAATAAGLKVVDLRGIETTNQVACMYQAIGEPELANVTKEYIKGLLEADPALVLETCLVYPQAGHTGSYCREDVIKELAEEMPGRINVLAEGYGNWATEPTQKLVEDWIQTYPNLNYVQCANDEEALGAINALEAAGIKDKVLVTGGNGAMQGTDLILEERLDATPGQDKDVFAKNIAELTIMIFDGTYTELPEFNTETMTYLPTLAGCQIVTIENAAPRKEALQGFMDVFATY